MYSYEYEYQARGTIESVLVLFYPPGFMPIWAPTMVQRVQNSGWGFFHGGCRAKPAISAQGVHGRTSYAISPLEISPMHQPTIHRPAPNLGKKSGWVAGNFQGKPRRGRGRCLIPRSLQNQMRVVEGEERRRWLGGRMYYSDDNLSRCACLRRRPDYGW